MPKSAFKNPFNRRKSSGNILEFAPDGGEPSSTQSSFKVIERPDRNTFHGADFGRPQSQARLSQARPFNSPLQQIRGKSAEDLGPGTNRGSGGTHNSGSSGYYDSSAASARYSSTSTLPSSVDPEREQPEEDLFPQKRTTTPMHHSVSASADEPLPPPPSFSSRASRAFSFGLKSKQPVLKPDAAASVPTSPVRTAPAQHEPLESPGRERAMTTSSYASTAVPPKVDAKPSLSTSAFGHDFGDDFGNDFGVNMFDSLKHNEEPLPPPPPSVFHRTVRFAADKTPAGADYEQESEPMFPPRSYSRQGFTPSPVQLKHAREDAGSPYSWDGRNSHDGLVAGSAMSSPRNETGPGLPSIANGIAPAFLGGSKQGYSLVPERNGSPGIERTSPDEETSEAGFTNRQTQLDDGDRWSKKYELHDPQEPQNTATNSMPKKSSLKPQVPAVAGASRSSEISAGSADGGSRWANELLDTTPRAAKVQARQAADEPLFDVSPSGPPSRAIRPGSQQRTESGTPKRMTKAQFEMLSKHGDTSNPEEATAQHSDDEYDDDDEDERAKHMTKQRRRQEANMAVYRQQMKKVTGGGPSDLPSARPSLDRASQSAPGSSGWHMGGIGGTPPAEALRGKSSDEDEDDDVPLGILQAHGFPSSTRPPTRLGEGAPSTRRGSVAGSVAGGAGQGNLPPFARRLPADPYFGAGLVNPPTRESLAFSSAGSMYGGGQATTPMGNPLPTPGAHPGGLVGVIAGEEQAKAARRANPNATGYGQQNMALPGNIGMPQMPRTMSMGNVQPPQMYSNGGYPPMPMMPPQMMGQGPDPNAQMQQFMQMQMQFMQNMMAMQQQSMGQAPPQQMQQPPSNNFLAPPPSGNRPNSMAQGRAMTMMQPPSNWGGMMQQQRPTSSFAPNGNLAPSMQNLDITGGPGPGYTPSIAPSERSNIGQPSRYRPVQTGEGSVRAQSMTSSMTLQALQNPQHEDPRKSTIRVVDRPKGASKVSARPVDPEEDEEEGWAEMAKKRNEKKFRWGKKDKHGKQEPALSELYQNFE